MKSLGEIEYRLTAGDTRAVNLCVRVRLVKSRTGKSHSEAALSARSSTRYRRAGVLLGVVLTLIGGGTVGWAAVGEDERQPKPAPQWRVSATVNYSSGSYGTDSTTNILYAPMTVRRIFRDGDVSVTIPFVMISGTGAVRLVGGVPTRTSRATASPVGALAAGSGGGKRPGTSPLSSSTTDGGLGDIILRGRYYLIEESTIMPLVALTGRVKLPTADAEILGSARASSMRVREWS